MPLHKIIIGEGGKHLGEGLAALKQQVDAHPGGNFRTRIVKPDAVIDVWGIEDQHYIMIQPDDGTDLLSGVVAPGRIEEILEKTKPVKVVGSFEPSALQAAYEKKGRSWRKEKKIAVEASAANKRIDNPYLQFAQTADVCPAQFTGTMVLAAQLALGIKDCVIEYQHSFSCTHGIYMAGATPWLIEISTSGIRAMKLTGTKKHKNKAIDAGIKAKFPMIPDGKAFPIGAKLAEAKKNGTVRTLMSAGPAFYSVTPYFSDCGWAFNDLGTEAVNVGWSWPDDYKRGHLFKIRIDGDATNGPIAASCTEMEQGYIFHPQSQTRLNYPTGLSGEVYTFDMKRFGFVQIPPPVASWSTPIYAYYKGNELQIFRHTIFNNLSPYRPGGWVPFDPFNHGPYHVNSGSDIGKTPASEEVYGVECEYRPELQATGMMDYSGPGISDPISIPGGVYTSRKLSEKNCGLVIVDGLTYSYSLGYPVEDWGTKAVMESYTFYGTQSDGSYQTRILNHSLSISPRNRCAVFIGTNDLTTDAYHRNTEYYLGFGWKNTSAVNLYSSTDTAYILKNTKTAQDYNLSTVPFNYVAKIINGYNHAGVYAPVMIPGPLQAVSTDIFFGGFTGSAGPVGPYHIIGTFDPSPVPPGGIDHGHTVDNQIEILNFSCRNGPISHDKTVSSPTERESFFKSFAVSPDVLGSYTYLSSGYSGFLQSGYASKFPNGTSGQLIHKVSAGSEDTAPWGITTTWIGYS